MKISDPRGNGKQDQTRLWDWVGDRDLPSQAMARPFVGDFFEEATRVLSGGVRLKTETDSLCPDLLLPNGFFCEVKSVGNSRQSLLYEHRIEKYERLMRQGKKLLYVFWLHNCRSTDYKTLFTLREALARSVVSVAVVPAKVVYKAAKKGTSRLTGYSGTRESPSKLIMKLAYVLKREVLMNWMSGQTQVAHMEGGVYGYDMEYVRLFEQSNRSLMFKPTNGDK